MTVNNNTINQNGLTNPTTQPQERKVANKELSKDDFMMVFLKQLQMQNPMKPYDSSSMLQQMSQLTSITATEKLNKTVDKLNANLIQSQVVDSAQLIGKHVQTPSKVAPYIKDYGVGGSVMVPKEASNIMITIKDKGGKVVHTVMEPRSGAGVLDFNWDGKDAEGKPIASQDDYYHIEASGVIDGKQTAMVTCGTYKVNSVALDQHSGAILNVDLLGGIGMDSVLKII